MGAVTGLIYTLLALLRDEGATHVGCATDHVIRSFRNSLYDGYKTEAGVPRELLAQFPLAERAMEALGVVVWPMVEFEADDALATAAARWACCIATASACQSCNCSCCCCAASREVCNCCVIC